MIECDVAIVGAGPAGCAAARECASRGLKVVIVEKKKIPRHKPCSGILVPDSIKMLTTHFGALPPHVLADPPHIHAMHMHFPDGYVGHVPIDGTIVWRDRLDAWLCGASGAEVLDETRMQSFSEKTGAVELFCVKSRGNPFSVHSKIVIAADGAYSDMVRTIDPMHAAKLPWYVALQDTYACDCTLEAGFFHFFAFPEISRYPSAYVKDGLLVMEVVVKLGERAMIAMARFKNYLWKKFDVQDDRLVRRLGCRVAYAAPRGLFCFGTDRVLVAGEASGLLNLFGEGISSALASGIVAGKASVNGIQTGEPPGRLYRQEVEKERRRTVDSFNYRTILFRKGNSFDFKKGFHDLSWKERVIFATNLVTWRLRIMNKTF